MVPRSYKPRKKFMELAISEAKRAGDRGDYPIGAVITRLTEGREVVIASAGNRVKTSGSSIKHVELETLKYVSSGYGRYLPDFVLYSTHEPCAMCAGCAYRELRPYQPPSLWNANRRSRRCTFSCWQAQRSLKTGSLCLVQSSSASKCRELLS